MKPQQLPQNLDQQAPTKVFIQDREIPECDLKVSDEKQQYEEKIIMQSFERYQMKPKFLNQEVHKANFQTNGQKTSFGPSKLTYGLSNTKQNSKGIISRDNSPISPFTTQINSKEEKQLKPILKDRVFTYLCSGSGLAGTNEQNSRRDQDDLHHEERSVSFSPKKHIRHFQSGSVLLNFAPKRLKKSDFRTHNNQKQSCPESQLNENWINNDKKFEISKF